MTFPGWACHSPSLVIYTIVRMSLNTATGSTTLYKALSHSSLLPAETKKKIILSPQLRRGKRLSSPERQKVVWDPETPVLLSQQFRLGTESRKETRSPLLTLLDQGSCRPRFPAPRPWSAVAGDTSAPLTGLVSHWSSPGFWEPSWPHRVVDERRLGPEAKSLQGR